MKKLISTFILVFCISAGIFAQITFETKYQGTITGGYLLGIVKLNQNSSKYIYVDGTRLTNPNGYVNVQYNLYNLDHSFYKSIALIKDTLAGLNLGFIQENLFNTDSKIELAYIRNKASAVYSYKIIDEDGNSLFERDNVTITSSTLPYNMHSFGPVKTENGVKLILIIDNTKDKEVYALGGTLISGIKDPNDDGEEMIELSPNPSKEFTRISYKLPENVNTAEIIVYTLNGSEIKRFTVDRTFSDLIVSTDNLPSGSYFYTLVADNQIIGTKKSFVIK